MDEVVVVRRRRDRVERHAGEPLDLVLEVEPARQHGTGGVGASDRRRTGSRGGSCPRSSGSRRRRVPSPASKSVTATPRRARCSAVEAPMIPAPSTATDRVTACRAASGEFASASRRGAERRTAASAVSRARGGPSELVGGWTAAAGADRVPEHLLEVDQSGAPHASPRACGAGSSCTPPIRSPTARVGRPTVASRR